MAVHDEHPTNQSKKRGWATYIPRPGSSHGSGSRPGSSSSAKSSSSSVSGVSTPPATPRSNSFVGSFGKRPGSSGGNKFKEVITTPLATPQEGKELDISQLQPLNAPICSPQPTHPQSQPQSPRFGGGTRQPQKASTTDAVSPPPSRPASRPTTPKRWSSSLLLTSSSSFSSNPHLQELANEADQLVLNAIERTSSKQSDNHHNQHHQHQQPSRMSSSKSYLSSMIGGLSMSLSRTSTRDSVSGTTALEEEEREREKEKDKEKDRGRSLFKPAKRIKSASHAPFDTDTDTTTASRSGSRARSQSPFFFRKRRRDRELSPTPQPLPLAQSETDLSDASSAIHPRNAFTDDQDSGEETVGETDYSDDDDDYLDDFLDPVTERNTEQNAIIIPVVHPDPVNGIDEAETDPLGEGVNVVVPPEPYFPTSLNALGGSGARNKRGPRRRKSVKHHEPLPFHTSRPIFQRDRCTITVTQGDPVAKLSDRRKRKYVVASDLSEESRYAVEWGIGTVLRDGDEMLVVTVVENESKVDPEIPNLADRSVKLRSQQERQGLAYILVRQVTGLLQRTRLNISVSCQAWHAKNSRHMLLDVVDYTGPTMLIVGSRGLGQLNGILLGSTSHYLIQKCSVPVMVARRRLKRPPKKSAHLHTHRQHVKLSEAGIDRVAAKVDQDVKVMRDEIQKDDSRRDGGPGSRDDRRGLVVSPSNTSEELLEQEEDEGEEGDIEGDVDNEGDGEGTLVKEMEEVKVTG